MRELKKVKRSLKRIFETRSEDYQKKIEKHASEFYSNPFRF